MKASYEVVEELFASTKAGDNDAKFILISKLNPLIRSSIERYCPVWDYYEDLYQDGVLVAIECIDMHDCNNETYLDFVRKYLKLYYLDTFKYLIGDEISDFEQEINLLEMIEDRSIEY